MEEWSHISVNGQSEPRSDLRNSHTVSGGDEWWMCFSLGAGMGPGVENMASIFPVPIWWKSEWSRGDLQLV